jgi:hypothetical protein
MTVNIDNIYGIHNTMLNRQILLAYKGEFNNKIVNSLLSNAKVQMLNLELELPVRKKLYNIMVECLENINRYAGDGKFESNDLIHHYPLFLLGASEEGFYITVGNMINDGDKDILIEKLDDINKLSREELKSKYRDTILASEVTDTEGAGLGIIDMAIKSENPLEYKFNSVKDDISFFILEIKV